MTALPRPRLLRETPRRAGGVGVSLATTLANARDGLVARAVVRATLTTRVARETPTPPALRGALVVIQSGMTRGDSVSTRPVIRRGDSVATHGDSSVNLAVIPASTDSDSAATVARFVVEIRS